MTPGAHPEKIRIYGGRCTPACTCPIEAADDADLAEPLPKGHGMGATKPAPSDQIRTSTDDLLTDMNVKSKWPVELLEDGQHLWATKMIKEWIEQ